MKENLSVGSELATLVKNMPLKLKANLLNVEILVRAIDEDLIEVRNGRLHWKVENLTLLAVFCGMLWCGDRVEYNKRMRCYVLIQGDGKFPNRDLKDLFGVSSNLSVLRRHKFASCVTQEYEYMGLFRDYEGG